LKFFAAGPLKSHRSIEKWGFLADGTGGTWKPEPSWPPSPAMRPPSAARPPVIAGSLPAVLRAGFTSSHLNSKRTTNHQVTHSLRGCRRVWDSAWEVAQPSTGPPPSPGRISTSSPSYTQFGLSDGLDRYQRLCPVLACGRDRLLSDSPWLPQPASQPAEDY
jgi:hypothetical protein